MGKMIIDDSLRNKLSHAQEEMEFLDQKGVRIGFFFPAEVYQKLMRSWARLEFADDPDIPAARDQAGGMTTAEVLAHLRQIEKRKKGA
jgi:hypothetical protein